MKDQPTACDWRAADAVLLLEAPRREAPDVCDASRATFSFGLILAFPVALILAALALLARLPSVLPAFPKW